MSRLPSETPMRSPDLRGHEVLRRSLPEDWRRGQPRGSNWALGALVLLGLGALGIYYLGPDLVRYLKIERM
jgi:hypothetical protein